MPGLSAPSAGASGLGGCRPGPREVLLSWPRPAGAAPSGAPAARFCQSATFCFSAVPLCTSWCMTLLPCTRASHCDSFCSCCCRICSSRASMRLWSSASLSGDPLFWSCTCAFGRAFSSAAPNGHHDCPRPTSSHSVGSNGFAVWVRLAVSGCCAGAATGSPDCLLPPMASQGSLRTSSAPQRFAMSGSTSLLQSLLAASE
mmetsp:Transcript_44752/g.127765  ORF Transcript_44752/g.127765 Transcript_44752/m.127765 type:complete len:201 (+) Transcript_44752:381-983(+)